MKTTAVVIGAGQAGLAMSHCLAARSIDHVVLERGEVAHSWKTERWDSLRLLTPNWMSRRDRRVLPNKGGFQFEVAIHANSRPENRLKLVTVF